MTNKADSKEAVLRPAAEAEFPHAEEKKSFWGKLKRGLFMTHTEIIDRVDAAVSALFTDLDERGLLETTLVVLCGEFSRTPKMNDGGNGGAPRSMGTPGRDHWGDAMFCLMGGGGVKGGQVVGATDRLGTRPVTTPLKPTHVHATIYQVLGVDLGLHLTDPTGRPGLKWSGRRRVPGDRSPSPGYSRSPRVVRGQGSRPQRAPARRDCRSLPVLRAPDPAARAGRRVGREVVDRAFTTARSAQKKDRVPG